MPKNHPVFGRMIFDVVSANCNQDLKHFQACDFENHAYRMHGIFVHCYFDGSIFVFFYIFVVYVCICLGFHANVYRSPIPSLGTTNITPEKQWLEHYFPFGMVTFQRLCKTWVVYLH